MLKFIIKENIKEGYSLKEQLLDSICLLGAFIIGYLLMVM
jgi:hypothetical protein